MAMLPGEAPKDTGDFTKAMLDERWSKDDFFKKNLIHREDPKNKSNNPENKKVITLWNNLITRTRVDPNFNERMAIKKGEKPGREIEFETCLFHYSSYMYQSTH